MPIVHVHVIREGESGPLPGVTPLNNYEEAIHLEMLQSTQSVICFHTCTVSDSHAGNDMHIQD